MFLSCLSSKTIWRGHLKDFEKSNQRPVCYNTVSIFTSVFCSQ